MIYYMIDYWFMEVLVEFEGFDSAYEQALRGGI